MEDKSPNYDQAHRYKKTGLEISNLTTILQDLSEGLLILPKYKKTVMYSYITRHFPYFGEYPDRIIAQEFFDLLVIKVPLR